jgi:hypothetical protein
MQGSNQGYTDSPIPDSPYQEYVSPRVITPTMRSDSPIYQSRYPQRGRRRQERPRWRVQVPVENVEEERRIFKGKWGPGRCRPSRRHRRPPPPPSPPAAAASGLNQRTMMTIAAHGGRKTLKNRSRNGSRKCKSTRRK